MTMAERDRKIVKLVRACKEPLHAIGARFGLSYQRVNQIAHRAKATRPVPYGRLSAAERAKIEALHASGMPLSHIGRAVGRNATVVGEYLVRSGRHKRSRDPKPWSRAEDAVLTRKYGKAWGGVRLIAEELHRTRNEVIGRANRLGLGKRKAQQKRTATEGMRSDGHQDQAGKVRLLPQGRAR